VVVRWLLPIIAMFALLGNAVAAFAAAGTHRVTSCCCPDPDTCICGDHGDQKPDAQMGRCGGNAVKVTPTQAVALLVEPIALVAVELAMPVYELAAPILRDRTLEPPEPPPI
jgi:hypothetical protein